MKVSFKWNGVYGVWEFYFTYDQIAWECGVSYNVVRRCVEWLVEAKQITTQKTTRGLRIKVLNYEQYQSTSQADVQADVHAIEEERRKNERNTIPQVAEVLESFNSITGKSLRLTDKKKNQVQARLKTFTVEEITQAINNRMKSKWHIENWWTGDWDSLFCNDEKIDKMLNLQKEPEVKKVYIPKSALYYQD